MSLAGGALNSIVERQLSGDSFASTNFRFGSDPDF
jgi:hypothetical protein